MIGERDQKENFMITFIIIFWRFFKREYIFLDTWLYLISLKFNIHGWKELSFNVTISTICKFLLSKDVIISVCSQEL